MYVCTTRKEHISEVSMHQLVRKFEALITDPDKQGTNDDFLTVIKGLIRGKMVKEKRWSVKTKRLFAFILDYMYGGPALAKQIMSNSWQS